MSADTCWSCGAPHKPQRPRRVDFGSDPEYLVACLVWLDHTYPERVQHRERIAEYARLELEADEQRVIARIHELLKIDEWDEGQQEEGDRLAALYLEYRRQARLQKEKSS